MLDILKAIDVIILATASLLAGITFGALSFGAGIVFLTFWSLLDFAGITTITFIDAQVSFTFMHTPMLAVDIARRFAKPDDCKLFTGVSTMSAVGATLGNLLLIAVGANIWIKRSLGGVFFISWIITVLQSRFMEGKPNIIRDLTLDTCIDSCWILCSFFAAGCLTGLYGIGSPPLLIMYLVNNYSKDDRKYKPLAWAFTFAARFVVFCIGDSFKRELFHVYAIFGGLSLIGYYIGDRMTYNQSAFRTCMISILLFESITTMTIGIHETVYMWVLIGSASIIGTYTVITLIIPCTMPKEPENYVYTLLQDDTKEATPDLVLPLTVTT